MKIVYCTPSLYLPGGIERVLTTKANYLAEVMGYEVFIILTDGKEKSPYYTISSKVHIIQLDINFEELWHLSFKKKIVAYLRKQYLYKKKLTKTIFNIKPDITVSLLRREINFIHSIKDGSKKIGELHINRKKYRNFEKGDSNILKKKFSIIWIYSLLQKIKKLDKFIVLSQEDKKNWPELKNIEVIPNPLPFMLPKQQSTLTSQKVIAVGRYSYQKGFDILLRSWYIISQKHPEWELHIYGEGDKTAYQQLAYKLNLNKNTFLEDATPDIIQKYNESSIFILSSRFEGFGMVIIEAMSCGLPVVSFDCPCGPKDIITDGENGYLVTNENIEELANKTCFLIENKHIREKIGRTARIDVERYRIEKVMSQWVELFNKSVNYK